MDNCPTEAELAGFLNDGLPPTRQAEIAAHVDVCRACQARLDRLSQPLADALGAYRRPVADSSPGIPAPGDTENRTLVIGQNRLPPALPASPPLPEVPGFQVLSEIGRGGMAVVYKARHRRLNRLVALKMILAGGAADTRTVQRFLFEAEVTARIQHPQVVQVYEADVYPGPSGIPVPYLAMELLEGGSLSQRLREVRLTPRQAARLIEGIARAVHAAHSQGIVHRDLKPGNILFPSDPAEDSDPAALVPADATPCPLPIGRAKVTDFGLAKFTESGRRFTGTGQVVGTPHYMAPEQAAGQYPIGPPADVYALGAILFECLAERPPFPGEELVKVLVQVVNEPPPDLLALQPHLPRDLAAIVSRCLAKEPQRRYATAEELADDLRRFLENLPTRARPLGRSEKLKLWVRRNPVVAALTSVLLLVVCATFLLVGTLWWKAEQTAREERIARVQAKGLRELALATSRDLEEQKRLADRRLAELEFARAVASCEDGRIDEGLEQLLRCLELSESVGLTDLARVARVNLESWHQELPPHPRRLVHPSRPLDFAFHPDGRRLLTGCVNGSVFLWDIPTGRIVRSYETASALQSTLHRTGLSSNWKLPGYRVWSVAISPDGSTLAAGNSAGLALVWDIDNPKPRLRFAVADGVTGDVWSVAFAPDGTLWTTDTGAGLRCWDVSGQKERLLREGRPPAGVAPGDANVLLISPDGERIYTGHRGGVIIEWDAATAKQVRLRQTDTWISALALTADGQRLAFTGPAGQIGLLDRQNLRLTQVYSLAGAYGNGVDFAPARRLLAASDGDGTVRFWDLVSHQPQGNPVQLTGELRRLRFLPGSDAFAVIAGDSVALCRAPTSPGRPLRPGEPVRIHGLSFSPDGTRLAVAAGSVVEIYDPRSEPPSRPLRQQWRPAGPMPLCIRFDPDPRRHALFRGLREGFDRFDLHAPDALPRPAGAGLGRVRRIEWLGTHAVYAAGEALVARYDPVTLEQLAVAQPVTGVQSESELGVLAVHPRGQEVLVSAGSRVVFLEPETLRPTRSGWSADDVLLDACYTPDGRHVLVGRRDNQAELLDAATGNPVGPPMPHSRAVLAVAVSPDGRYGLTGSRDATARFWDITTGLPLGPMLRHHGPVTHLAFIPGTDRVVTATDDGEVISWRLPPEPVSGTPAELRARYGRSAGLCPVTE